MNLLTEIDKAVLGTQNQQLSALLTAILYAHGPIIIPPEVAERVFKGGTVRSEVLEGGAVKLWVENAT